MGEEMGDPLLKKLQHRAGTPVVVLWPPDEVAPVVERWEAAGVAVQREPSPDASFVLAFVRSCAEIEEQAAPVVASLTADDPAVWLAYPKKSSKRYASDVGRDDSWQAVGDLDFEPVSQVAVDDDWSALRFRRTRHVKSLTRGRVISPEGKRRLGEA